MAPQKPAADVGVQGRRLHPEARDGLLGRQSLLGAERLGGLHVDDYSILMLSAQRVNLEESGRVCRGALCQGLEEK
jgi:hypothetical protein